MFYQFKGAGKHQMVDKPWENGYYGRYIEVKPWEYIHMSPKGKAVFYEHVMCVVFCVVLPARGKVATQNQPWR